MSTEDFATLQRAANALWPDAILSNSGIILGLAKLAAKDILKRGRAAKQPERETGLGVCLHKPEKAILQE